MVKKIVYTISFIILFLFGGIIFWWQNNSPILLKRDYIVISIQGQVNYLFPLPFKPGVTVYQIISYFDLKLSACLSCVYIKDKKTWKLINLTMKIYKDSVFKIV